MAFKFINQIKKILRPIKSKIVKNIFSSLTEINGKPILDFKESNQLLKEIIRKKKKGFLITRLGTTEGNILLYELKTIGKKEKYNYPPMLKKNLSDLSGVFPTDDGSIKKFSNIYSQALLAADVLGVRSDPDEKNFWSMESKIIDNYKLNPILVNLNCLSPLTSVDPWTAYLGNKKVLIIHPFVESIKRQLKKRTILFKNPLFPRDFNPSFIKAIQSLADNKSYIRYKSWFAALEFMKSEIHKHDFDIALIGAGAYGLPLAYECSKLGKKAIHVGGALQLFFGIKGRRFIENTEIKKLINKHWIFPLKEEMPAGADKVEGACYW
jgi:hypothetical protein